MQIMHHFLRSDHVFLLPDSVEDVHWKGASLHRQNSTRVLVGIPGLVQVEEVMEFLQMKKLQSQLIFLIKRQQLNLLLIYSKTAFNTVKLLYLKGSLGNIALI